MLKIVCLQSWKRKRDQKVLLTDLSNNFSDELIIEKVVLIEKSNIGLSLASTRINSYLSKSQERTKINHSYSACEKYSLVYYRQIKTWLDISYRSLTVKINTPLDLLFVYVHAALTAISFTMNIKDLSK